MRTTELAKGIYWVGAIDWDVRDFHGYSTYRGTTYNAFLIVDEKITLFDTVKSSHIEDLLRHIRAIIDPAKDRLSGGQPCRDGPFRRLCPR